MATWRPSRDGRICARIVLGRLIDLVSCDIGFAVDIEQGSDLALVEVQGVDALSPLVGEPRRR